MNVVRPRSKRVWALAALALLGVTLTAYHVLSPQVDETPLAHRPGLLLPRVLAPPEPPRIDVVVDERYDPAEFEGLIAVLHSSFQADCNPGCAAADWPHVQLVRPSDGSIAVEVRVERGLLLAVKRPGAQELLISAGGREHSSLIALDAAAAFDVKHVHALPDRGTHRVYLGLDFVLSHDERHLFYRMERREREAGCSQDGAGWTSCLGVLDLETGDVYRAALDGGCATRITASGDDEALVTCTRGVFRVNGEGTVLDAVEIVSWNSANELEMSPQYGISRLANLHGFQREDGSLAVLTHLGFATHLGPEGEYVSETALPGEVFLKDGIPALADRDGAYLLVLGEAVHGPHAGTAYVFNPRDGRLLATYEYKEIAGNVASLARVPKTGDLAVLGWDGSLHLVSPGGDIRELWPASEERYNGVLVP